MSMTPERWQEVKDVLATALDLPGTVREAFLDQRCSDDKSLREEVELLLAQQHLTSEFLTKSFLGEAAASYLYEGAAQWIGRRVGAYQIVEQIGVGGMGEVYRAFRADDQYRKEVALKVIRPGQELSFVVSRFKNERQVLASLDHPNIAHLLDGGTTNDGLPYFVMELIEGQPLTEYCDKKNLPVRDRLKLFLQVCSAVQYAHQRLIVHRDLKPSNILVTKDCVPKLLDFGIAKILDAGPGLELAEPTISVFRLLTPSYASPEQIKGETITTASDVFSLGVLLYELLSGHRPHPTDGRAPHEIAQAVCELEPAKPSTVIWTKTGRGPQSDELNPESVSRVRGDSAEKLSRQMRGDLDNIVLKALRKEPQRRYTSVEQLAADISRHLENLPVKARKDTARYRTGKFVIRHKAGVTAAAIVLLVLLIGAMVTVQEGRVAKRRFNDVRSLANSLIFDVHDSIKDLPGSTPAKKLIVERALQYLNGLAQESKGDLGLQRELASAYERVGAVQGDYLENNLGDHEGALASYKKALELRKQIATYSSELSDRIAVASAYRLVAHQHEGIGNYAEARDAIGRAINISEALNQEVPNKSDVLYELSHDFDISASISYPGYPGDSMAREKVLQDYRRALSIIETDLRLNPDDIRVLYSYSVDLGNVGALLEPSDASEALKCYEKCLQIDSKLHQLSSDPRYQRAVAADYGTIGGAYDDLGDYPRALENNRKDLAIYQEMVDKDPKNVLLRRGLAVTYLNTAASYKRTGQIALAMDCSNRGLQLLRELAASSPGNSYMHRKLAEALVVRGIILTAANQPEAAIAEIERARTLDQTMYKAGAADYIKVAAADLKLADAEAEGRHVQGAEAHFQETLDIVTPLTTREPPDLDALYLAAEAYSGLGQLCLSAANAEPIQKRRADLTKAKSWFTQSLQTWQRIAHPYHSAPHSFEVGDPTEVAKQLKSTQAALAAVR